MENRLIVKRGATLSLYLNVLEGDPSSATVEAELKKTLVHGKTPGDEVAQVAQFGTTFESSVADDDSVLARWSFTLSAAEMEIEAGEYVMDARIETGASVIYTPSIYITVEERVTS